MLPYVSCVFIGKYNASNIVVSSYADALLLCYDGESNLPDKFLGELKKHFTAFKLEIANPLIHIGLEIAKVSDRYHITMTRYERELVVLTNIGDATVVCPTLAEMQH